MQQYSKDCMYTPGRRPVLQSLGQAVLSQCWLEGSAVGQPDWRENQCHCKHVWVKGGEGEEREEEREEEETGEQNKCSISICGCAHVCSINIGAQNMSRSIPAMQVLNQHLWLIDPQSNKQGKYKNIH